MEKDSKKPVVFTVIGIFVVSGILLLGLLFFTEIFLNYARKSVVGLSFDFLAYNLVAFTCYTVYNFSMLYVPAIRQEYQEMYHQHVPVFIYSFIPLISGGDKRLILLCSRHARYVLYDLPVFYL